LVQVFTSIRRDTHSHYKQYYGFVSDISQAAMSVLLMEGTHNARHCNGFMYVASFMKIGTGVQAILRFGLRNFRGCDVGITDGRDVFIFAVEMGSGAVI
jgi:hypothetical protein